MFVQTYIQHCQGYVGQRCVVASDCQEPEVCVDREGFATRRECRCKVTRHTQYREVGKPHRKHCVHTVSKNTCVYDDDCYGEGVCKYDRRNNEGYACVCASYGAYRITSDNTCALRWYCILGIVLAGIAVLGFIGCLVKNLKGKCLRKAAENPTIITNTNTVPNTVPNTIIPPSPAILTRGIAPVGPVGPVGPVPQYYVGGSNVAYVNNPPAPYTNIVPAGYAGYAPYTQSCPKYVDTTWKNKVKNES